VVAAIVAIGLLVARIPLGAFPRLPPIFWYLLAFGLFLNSLASTPPVIHIGPLPVSLGALSVAVRLLLLAIILVVSAALVGWTTQLGTFAPALARLTRPLRVLRLPIDEWIVAIALALRCLPLLIDEMRTLNAARRLRYRDPSQQKQFKGAVIEIQDLVSTAIIVSLRRAHDLAERDLRARWHRRDRRRSRRRHRLAGRGDAHRRDRDRRGVVRRVAALISGRRGCRRGRRRRG